MPQRLFVESMKFKARYSFTFYTACKKKTVQISSRLAGKNMSEEESLRIKLFRSNWKLIKLKKLLYYTKK